MALCNDFLFFTFDVPIRGRSHDRHGGSLREAVPSAWQGAG
jgi:hypothetical protein